MNRQQESRSAKKVKAEAKRAKLKEFKAKAKEGKTLKDLI